MVILFRYHERMAREKNPVIQVTQFKAHCLRILDDVDSSGRSYTITKRGKPVARVIPVIKASQQPTLGRWKGALAATGDIVYCDWSDEFEATR
jgi:prevent-host-death family protein